MGTASRAEGRLGKLFKVAGSKTKFYAAGDCILTVRDAAQPAPTRVKGPLSLMARCGGD